MYRHCRKDNRKYANEDLTVSGGWEEYNDENDLNYEPSADERSLDFSIEHVYSLAAREGMTATESSKTKRFMTFLLCLKHLRFDLPIDMRRLIHSYIPKSIVCLYDIKYQQFSKTWTRCHDRLRQEELCQQVLMTYDVDTDHWEEFFATDKKLIPESPQFAVPVNERTGLLYTQNGEYVLAYREGYRYRGCGCANQESCEYHCTCARFYQWDDEFGYVDLPFPCGCGDRREGSLGYEVSRPSGSSLVVFQGQVWLIGGHNGLPCPCCTCEVSSIFIFDPRSASWSKSAHPLPEGRRGCTAVNVDDQYLVVCGGEVSCGGFSEGFGWQPCEDVSVGRSRLGLVQPPAHSHCRQQRHVCVSSPSENGFIPAFS